MAVSTGFYKRRRGILQHIESGKISLLESGIHDYLCLKANVLIDPAGNIPPGIVFSSAIAVALLCPDLGERTIRRKLDHLEEIGWIKRWKRDQGQRGNYPILVARLRVFERREAVRESAVKEYWVNASATTDWRNPVLVPCRESAVTPVEQSPFIDTRDLGETETKSSRSPNGKPRSPLPPTDDDLIKSVLEMPGVQDSGGMLHAAMTIILDRAHASGTVITSPKYLVSALQNFNYENGSDKEALLKRLGRVPL
jgi:hypothetical protein